MSRWAEFKAQMAASRRELAKDVNSTLHQVFFNQPAGPSEMGTPLSPTPKEVYDAKHAQGPPRSKEMEPEMG